MTVIAPEAPPETAASQGTPVATPSVARLVTEIVDDTSRLIGQQVEMLKAEFREDMTRTKSAASFAAVGVTLMTVGGLSLVFGLVYLMHEQFQIPMWTAWAGLGGVVLAAGVACGLIGKARFESFSPLPDKTARALQENLTWKTNP